MTTTNVIPFPQGVKALSTDELKHLWFDTALDEASCFNGFPCDDVAMELIDRGVHIVIG